MRPIVIVDVETTGLTSSVHKPFEISWLKIDLEQGIDLNESPMTFYNMLSDRDIDWADPEALAINGRSRKWLRTDLPKEAFDTQAMREHFYDDIRDVTLMGANVRFDAEMLMTIIPHSIEPWHHRLFDIQAFYSGVRKRMEILGLNDIIEELKEENEDARLTLPDHNSRNDVRAVRDILYLLLDRYM